MAPKPFIMTPVRPLCLVGLLLAGVTPGWPAGPVLTVTDEQGAAGRCEAPVSIPADFSVFPGTGPGATHFRLRSMDGANTAPGAEVPAQFEPDGLGSAHGTLLWLMPSGPAGRRRFAVEPEARPLPPRMRAQRDPAGGQVQISEAGEPVLRYNYQTNFPGEMLASVKPDDRKYARPRSDYIHPLYGPQGEELTKDWPVDHPHHRGIYWAWPEVDYHGQRGDLHALQRVFARPTGNCALRDGPVCALVEAENLWRWEDQEPIVLERTLIRAWRAGTTGRFLDLEFHFTALKDDVVLARRGTDHYGGLNLRLAAVRNQEITFHTDPPGTALRRAWAELSGVFPGGGQASLAVLQAPTNPEYPGDWVQYPEINWFQPTFPAAGTRYVLKQGQPLVLKFRLWICPGKAGETKLADGWAAYARPPIATLNPHEGN